MIRLVVPTRPRPTCAGANRAAPAGAPATRSLRIVVCAAMLVVVRPVVSTAAEQDTDQSRIADLVTASHILANEGVLDSYGHVSARSVSNPQHFFMPRAMAPAEVTAADIVELDMNCKPVHPPTPRLNGERFIHCAIYAARPDVQSVIHAHDLTVIPFGLTGIPLRPVVAQAGFLPPDTPLFDSRTVPENRMSGDIEVRTMTAGRALAATLGPNPVVLMARHGETVVGPSVRVATVRAIYTNIDARAEWAALAISHDVVSLDARELQDNAKENFDADRPWQNYRARMLRATSRGAVSQGGG